MHAQGASILVEGAGGVSGVNLARGLRIDERSIVGDSGDTLRFANMYGQP